MGKYHACPKVGTNRRSTTDEGGSTCVCHFAFDMLDFLETYNQEHPDNPLALRVGIHAGPVVAGVVGTKRMHYDVWGDTVNTASRMESTGVAGRVQVTKGFFDLLPPNVFEHEPRGVINIKGKGELETVFLTRSSHKKRKR